ncbi:pilus assembly protein CpaE [Kribbella antibiotica]|uniref:Pilus assembly protein CpaE n=1 Tax=Kribbella antibiotica TaxID=190195 RepID=A0A4V2YPS9_9ACTN|nr:pilus assembly protein CpaE [Kribbella antibiotica]TDD59217.1 pilus assembly protein CpaE [Kribbella antibiotica]
MITLEQAARLRKAGVLWTPAAGDRFMVPDREMDDDVFVVSDMTVEVHDYQGSKVIGFNGTTEWALDSIEQREVIWLPREEQLRALLGPHFRRLEAVADGYAVELTGSTHSADDAEQAYANAVLHLLAA